MHKSIQEAMTSNPTTVAPTRRPEEAAKIMKSEDIGSLPIVEDDKLVGVITDRDLAIRVVAEGRATDTTVGRSRRRTSSPSIRSRASTRPRG